RPHGTGWGRSTRYARPAVDPVLPDYGGACIDSLVPVLLEGGPAPAWLPEPVLGADQLVLLVLDGLGWEQLKERPALAPTLHGMVGGPITTVVPSTTATALTSLTTGLRPCAHGMVGYRVLVDHDVLNVLQWRTEAGDARERVPPAAFQPVEPFGATRPPVVTRAEFGESGFTGAHLAGVRLFGWRMPSTVVAHTAALLDAGEPFVYAYYDGIDKVAHEHGL